MAKLADAPDLGSGAERHGGSSPFTRTCLVFVFLYLSNGDIYKGITEDLKRRIAEHEEGKEELTRHYPLWN